MGPVDTRGDGTTRFHVRDLSIHELWYPQCILEPISCGNWGMTVYSCGVQRKDLHWIYNIMSLVVVQWLNHVQLSATPWNAARQVPLSSTISQSLLKSMSIESVMLSTKLIGFPRWQRNRWTWNTSLPMDTSGIHLQTQKCLQNTSWEQAGVPDHRKRIYRTTQDSVGQRN